MFKIILIMKVPNILLSIIFLMLPFFGFSQDIPSSKWGLNLYLKGNVSTKVWTRDFDYPESFSFEKFGYGVGYGAGTDIQFSLSKKWYFVNSLDYVNRRTVEKTRGFFPIQDENGNFILLPCDAVEKQVHQGIISLGGGYQLFPFLSLELSPYIQWNLSKEKFKICDYIDWTEPNYYYEKGFDLGLSPSIRLTWKSFNAKFTYSHGFRRTSELSLTDDNGNLIGNVGTHNRMLSVGLGYNFF